MCGSWLPCARNASFVEAAIGCVCDSVLGKPRLWSCKGLKGQSRAQHESALKGRHSPTSEFRVDQLERDSFLSFPVASLRLFYELFRRVLCAVISNTNGWERQPESEMCLNTQKMQKCRLAATVACSVVTLVVLICLTSAISLGQTSGQETNIASAGSDGSGDHAASNGVSASGNTNAEVLQELERMRVRIQQLESQLRQQSSGATPVTVDSAQQLAAEAAETR